MLPRQRVLLGIALAGVPLMMSTKSPAIPSQVGDATQNKANVATMTKMTTQAGTPVYLIGGAVKPPKVILAPAPNFPHGLRASCVAMVVLIVNEQGLPESVTIAKINDDRFAAGVLEAVRAYRLQPAMLTGKPVAVTMRTVVKYEYSGP
jgi:outer membrane biosynthesis protein TonB